MKRVASLFLVVFMVCSLVSIGSAAADAERWWEQDVWSTDVLLSLGAVLPDYDPASDTYRPSHVQVARQSPLSMGFSR